MKALVCEALNDWDQLVVKEVPDLVAGPGQLLIGVHACGTNFSDTLIIKGQYQVKAEPPFTPGLEVSGEVLALGEGVEGFQVGDMVLSIIDYGGYAEQAVVPVETTVKIPAGMDPVTAAAFPVAYGTSHLAFKRANLKPGEVVLVHGAAGGVGLTAVEIAKRMGATVIATAGGAEKLAIAKAHGADHLIDYKTEDVRSRVKELTGGEGVDVVYDPVGGEIFEASMRCVKWDARLLVIGFAAGDIQQIPANIVLVKNISVIGLYWGSYAKQAPQVLRESLEELMGWYAEGSIKPLVSATYPLEDATEAFRALKERRSTGKVAVVTDRAAQ